MKTNPSDPLYTAQRKPLSSLMQALGLFIVIAILLCKSIPDWADRSLLEQLILSLVLSLAVLILCLFAVDELDPRPRFILYRNGIRERRYGFIPYAAIDKVSVTRGGRSGRFFSVDLLLCAPELVRPIPFFFFLRPLLLRRRNLSFFLLDETESRRVKGVLYRKVKQARRRRENERDGGRRETKGASAGALPLHPAKGK